MDAMVCLFISMNPLRLYVCIVHVNGPHGWPCKVDKFLNNMCIHIHIVHCTMYMLNRYLPKVWPLCVLTHVTISEHGNWLVCSVIHIFTRIFNRKKALEARLLVERVTDHCRQKAASLDKHTLSFRIGWFITCYVIHA